MILQKKSFFVSTAIKSTILILFLLTIFFQILKSVSNLYYLFLISVTFLIVIIFIVEGRIKSNKNKYTKISFYTFYLLLSLACIHSLYYLNTPLSSNTSFNLSTYIVALSRMMIMPSIVFIFAILISSCDNLSKYIKLYIIFFALGSVSMIVQQFTGQIEIFGDLGPYRFAGLIPYNSSLGNITIYGTGIGVALLITSTHSGFNKIQKSFLIMLLLVGVFLTMQKAALINLIICLLILSVFFLKLKQLIFPLLIFIFFIIGIALAFPDLLLNIISLTANTFGFELAENSRNEALYRPITERFVDRLTGRLWLSGPESLREFLLGWGLLGGGGSLGINFDTTESGNYFTIGAPHNQYMGIFLIIGSIGLTVFLILIFSLQLDLYHKYKYYNDELAKTFFFANLIFYINLIVAEGSLFHPYTSFIFFISIYYVIFYNSFNLNK
jgi:hypothetical protein